MAPIHPYTPPALNHLVIFNPTRKSQLSDEPKQDGIERNRDLEDDLAQAAQILFYTSHAQSDVSRDVMLRQVGLVKGLMSFTDMVAPGDNPGYWSVNSQQARIVVYSPEPDIFVYANIALAKTLPDPEKGKAEPAPTAQGIPVGMIVDALRRGYEDFRLLHGSLLDLLSSPDLTAILDKAWTRFAFQLETAILVPHPNPLSLPVWLGGYPSPPLNLESAANRAIDLFREDTDLGDTYVGVIGKDGPLSQPHDPALMRYLVTLLHASLPLPVIVNSEAGPINITEEKRKSSWAGWVPGMSAIPGMGLRTVGPPSRVATAESKKGPGGKEGKSRWPGLGLGGLGESLGSVGHVLSLGGSRSASASALQSESVEALSIAKPTSDSSSRDPTPSTDHEVLQTVVSLGDLAAAQAEPDLELAWERRRIWLEEEGRYQESSLWWIIRDTIILYIIQPVDTSTIPPSTSATLSLLSKLSAIISPDDAQSQHRPPSLANSAIHSDGTSTTSTGPGMDQASAISLKELKHVLNSNLGLSEVFARTSASRFLAASRTAQDETYMLVGKKDASLVDADHALRSFILS